MDHLKDPILSSVIPMVAPTWCHRVNVDWPDFGSDTFNLVIHLRNVQQLAFRFPAFLRCPAGPVVPWEPW